MLKKLFQIEYIKARSNKQLRTIITLHFLLFIIAVLIGSKINISIPGFSFHDLYMFPDVWQFFTWIASWFNILLVILIIILTGNEFTYKTFRQQVINGFDSDEIILQKIIDLFFLSIYGFLLILISALISGFIFTESLTFNIIFTNMGILFSYFLQTLAFMSLGMLIIFIFKNTSLSIVLFLLYRIIIEPVLRAPFEKNIRAYFPSKLFSTLTPIPDAFRINYQNTNFNIATMQGVDEFIINPWGHHFLVIAYIIIFLFISKQIIKNRSY